MDHLNIDQIVRGMIYWECDDYQDAAFLSISGARREGQGIAVQSIEILTGAPQHHYEHMRPGPYGLRLYTAPQYSRPDWPALLSALGKRYAELDTAWRNDAIALAAERESATIGLRNELSAARRDAERYLGQYTAHNEVINLIEMTIARGGQNGLELTNRIRHIIATGGRPYMM